MILFVKNSATASTEVFAYFAAPLESSYFLQMFLAVGVHFDG